MKKLSLIAKETGLSGDTIRHTARVLNIEPVVDKQESNRYSNTYFTKEQEEKIHLTLFFERKLEYLIIESKLNKQ